MCWHGSSVPRERIRRTFTFCLLSHVACGSFGALQRPDSVHMQGRVLRVAKVIELTSFFVYRVWRSALILSFASCYIMWGMSSPLLGSIIPTCWSSRFHVRYFAGDVTRDTRDTTYEISLFPPPSPFGFHVVSRTNFSQSSDYIPCTMASSNSTKNEHIQRLSGLVRCKLGGMGLYLSFTCDYAFLVLVGAQSPPEKFFLLSCTLMSLVMRVASGPISDMHILTLPQTLRKVNKRK